MQSGWSIGILLVVMGGIGVSGFGGLHATNASWVIAGVLVATGALMFLRRPFAWWLGLGAAALTLASGIAAWAGKPQLALPVPPLLSIVIALYVTFRLLMSRAWFHGRGFLPKEP